MNEKLEQIITTLAMLSVWLREMLKLWHDLQSFDPKQRRLIVTLFIVIIVLVLILAAAFMIIDPTSIAGVEPCTVGNVCGGRPWLRTVILFI